MTEINGFYLHNQSNYGVSDACNRQSESKEPVTSIIIWGGDVANCAEDSLSKLIDEQSDNLTQLIYFPKYTKGGVLVRPKYHSGSRIDSITCPQLVHMTFPASIKRPYTWYIAPRLETMTAIIKADIYAIEYTQSWEHVGRFHLGLKHNFPSLKRISLAFGFFPEYKVYPLCEFEVPADFNWKLQRVLWVAIFKDQNELCYLSKLEKGIIRKIIQEIVSWKVFRYEENFILLNNNTEELKKEKSKIT